MFNIEAFIQSLTPPSLPPSRPPSLRMPALFRQVQGEVPGSPIFVMKLAPASRHLEVQLLADAHGQVTPPSLPPSLPPPLPPFASSPARQARQNETHMS